MRKQTQLAMTLCRHEGRTGLLLWEAEESDIPSFLRSPFLRGRWLTEVPIYIPGEEDELVQWPIDGWWLSASRAAAALAPVPLGMVKELGPAIAVWSLAAKWVVEAVRRQQLVPTVEHTADPGVAQARWRVAPVRSEDRSRLAGLAEAMPGVARAWATNGDGRVLTANAALREFTDAAADGLMRASTQETAPRPAEGPDWVKRLGRSLSGPEDELPLQGLADRRLPESLARWTAPAISMAESGRPLVGFQLEEPDDPEGPWWISFHLLDSSEDVRVPVSDIREGREWAREKVGRMNRPDETLLEGLGRCARIFRPIDRSLSERLPSGVELDAREAWNFLTRAAPRLQRAGYWVQVPSALSRVGPRRVRPRMRIGADTEQEGGYGLLAGALHYSWEASLGDDTLTPEEFRRLASSKAPLVRHRGRWVAVDPDEIERLRHLMEEGGGELQGAEALRLALTGDVSVPGASEEATADVVSDGGVEEALAQLRRGVEGRPEEAEPPKGLDGELRAYQKRGLGWLQNVTEVGFGACLADDMGLGKTIQVLALLLRIAERDDQRRRFLVVCPTSVLGNWRREVRRFSPDLGVLIHHGPTRAGDADALSHRMSRKAADHGTVVITSYALARRDIETFRQFDFDAVVLDEAQNIKNPESAQSRAVRELRSPRRMALTGTPMENRLAELWSIMDFLNPGLLGSRAAFKKQFGIPVERYGDEDATERLRRVIGPFILRRVKTDPEIAPDLPDKVETVRFCPLTREQASLYQAVLEESLSEIVGMEQGMERRGRILTMLTSLKQICNHPAQYLKDDNLDRRRSGKLMRFLELLDEVLEGGGHPLVFTQYRGMGEVLHRVLEERLGQSLPFYHGGVARSAREQLVQWFQQPDGPPVMIVSLKAGGTGLNLTRANHVFHYDRWWNPAVEDQATDRAFRIGQTRDVTVHRLVSQGTLEEQVHQILRSKRDLADRVVGTGETWLSELDDGTLRDLVSLGQDAVVENEG